MDREQRIKEALKLHKVISECPEDGRFNVYFQELDETRTFERVR